MGSCGYSSPPPARLGIPGSCEIIAASFSAMVMEFLNDPGNGRYRTSPDGHVWMTHGRIAYLFGQQGKVVTNSP